MHVCKFVKGKKNNYPCKSNINLRSFNFINRKGKNSVHPLFFFSNSAVLRCRHIHALLLINGKIMAIYLTHCVFFSPYNELLSHIFIWYWSNYLGDKLSQYMLKDHGYSKKIKRLIWIIEPFIIIDISKFVGHLSHLPIF